MQTPIDASQDKIKVKVRLEILPEEEKSASDKTLAQAIANDIANSNRFDQAQDYEVEVPHTGELGIPPEIWIWIAIGLAYVGKKFVDALIDKATEKAAGKVVEKVADLSKEIREILKKERYRKCEASIKVQSLPGGSDINEQGLLADALDRVATALKDLAKHLEKAGPNPNLPSTTGDIEITISIKVSHSHP